MNGAVYISFFQGQLESVLEQVVQLAVQEISKTVGSSLNTLLLETAVKEQENRQLRLRLQSRENRSRASSAPADGGGDSSVAGKNKAGKAAGHGRADGGGADPEQRQQQQLHVPGGQGIQAGVPTDARRLEQRGRVVDQLKSVMEQVLDFAVRELTKIVEASFDDLLLEITKMDKEQQGLEERLGHRGGGAGGRRRGSENDSVSPSGSEDAREEVLVSKDDRERPPILSVSQDWVPILDKVFGQKWCNDIRELEGGGGRGLGEPLSAHPLTLEPSPSSPQQDPRWTPLEDMEVFSPDDVAAESRRSVEGGLSSGSARRSSASMLHRLLTLPSQLLEDDDEAGKETMATTDASNGGRDGVRRDGVRRLGRVCLLPLTTREEEEEEEEEEEDGEDKGRKKKRRRVWSECEECGRRFSRMSLLKAHRQTHIAESAAAADTASPSSPPSSAAVALRCSQCGKRFSSATRLHSHIRAQH